MRRRAKVSLTSLPPEIIVLIATLCATPWRLLEVNRQLFHLLEDSRTVWGLSGSWAGYVKRRKEDINLRLQTVKTLYARTGLPNVAKRLKSLDLTRWSVSVDSRLLPIQQPTFTELAVSIRLVFNTLKVKLPSTVTVTAHSKLLKIQRTLIVERECWLVGEWSDGSVGCLLITLSLASILIAFGAFSLSPAVDSTEAENIRLELCIRGGDGSEVLLSESFRHGFKAESGRPSEFALSDQNPSLYVKTRVNKFTWNYLIVDAVLFSESWPAVPLVEVSEFVTVLRSESSSDFDYGSGVILSLSKSRWAFKLEFGGDLDGRLALTGLQIQKR
jgi:hypothetical protein